MADRRFVTVDDGYLFPTPLEARLGAKMDATINTNPKIAQLDSRTNALNETIGEVIVDGVTAVITDASGRHTFMAARNTDGAPTDSAAKLIGDSMGINELPAGEFLHVLTDESGRASDLATRAKDGQLADFVVKRLAPRIAAEIGVSGNSNDKWVHPGGDFVPTTTDMSSWSGWGSSGVAMLAPNLSELGNEIGAPYYNGGKGGERSWHTVARLGSDCALLTFPDDMIPASTTPVEVSASNMPPLSAMKPFDGSVGGVHGRLTSTDETLVFTRTTQGDGVAVDPGTPFVPEIGPQYRGRPMVIQLGKNDLTLEPNSLEGVIRATHAAVDWLSPVAKRVIVLGHHTNVGWTSGGVGTGRVYAANSEFSRRYGNQYHDIQGWLTSAQVWEDTEITPTQADLDAQATRGLAPSLSTDGLHLIPQINALISEQLRSRFAALNWY